MNARLRAWLQRVKWPLVWALVPLLAYIGSSKAVAIYREHQTMVRWINAADPYIAQLIKAQKATTPQPTPTSGP